MSSETVQNIPMLWEGETPYEVLSGHVPYPVAVHFASMHSGYAPWNVPPEHPQVLEYASRIMAVSHAWVYMLPGPDGVDIEISKYQTPMSYPATLVHYGIESFRRNK